MYCFEQRINLLASFSKCLLTGTLYTAPSGLGVSLTLDTKEVTSSLTLNTTKTTPSKLQLMTSTRSKDQELAEFTENPELILRDERGRMGDVNPNTGTNAQNGGNGAANNQQNGDNGRPVDPQRHNPAPELEKYLPDLENTSLSEALKRAIQWENHDEVLVECPRLKQYYGVDTLLVDKASGMCRLYIGGETESFPLPCALTKYPDLLLAKVLEADARQHTVPRDIPGELYTNIITEPLEERGLTGRLDVFAELCAMYAKNQVALQFAHLLPEDEKYQQICKYTIKGRRVSQRMDELIAVFTTDNALREAAGMKGYPLPTINLINKEINTREQAVRYKEESHNEVQEIIKIAYPPEGPVIQTTNCPGCKGTQRAQSPSFTMNATATTHTDCPGHGMT